MSFFATMQHGPRNRLLFALSLLALSFCFGDVMVWTTSTHPGSLMCRR